MLREFYAVTETSVYHVKDKGSDKIPYPSAEKIAQKAESALALGYKIQSGGMIAICQWLIAYIPEGGGYTSYQRRIEGVNTRYWGEKTSRIVALFKTKEEALQCLNCEDSRPVDPRWISQTKQVLDEIGNEHPAFEICLWPGLALFSS